MCVGSLEYHRLRAGWVAQCVKHLQGKEKVTMSTTVSADCELKSIPSWKGFVKY